MLQWHLLLHWEEPSVFIVCVMERLNSFRHAYSSVALGCFVHGPFYT